MHNERSDFFKDHARAYLENGYSIAPRELNTKHPVPSENWRQYIWHSASAEQLDDWIDRFAKHGISILTGRSVMCFDIDEDDKAAVELSRKDVEDVCGLTPLIRIGRAPRVAMMYGAAEPIVSARMPAHDILGLGTTVVATGLHPVTRQTYRWAGPHHPGNFPAADLPSVTNAMVSEVTERWMRRKMALNTVKFRLQSENLVVGFGGSRTKLIKQLCYHLLQGRKKARSRMVTRVLHAPDNTNWGLVLVPDVSEDMLQRCRQSA